MSTFAECPNCGNEDEGATIWNCGDCGCVHCKECDPEGGNCPQCGSRKMRQVGTIEPDSASDDDDDENDSYDECPRCGKNDDGADIWRCRECGCLHCRDCDPDSGCCPNCGSRKVKKIGYIENQ
jgi:hypothetical protein